ncbi:MAG: hypothetical protein PVSMB4_19410 [Ktedonobacterales bacterium]
MLRGARHPLSTAVEWLPVYRAAMVSYQAQYTPWGRQPATPSPKESWRGPASRPALL